ncbi:LuxR family transcriptional regulator [Arenibaculum sp.]|jgi:DNA-binding CsgD family transcriptional regulator|uniref:response regulator transcription factor n=1 Tax=Arenibaculum sp. TaxID=2865862 RepID=UPI002E1323D9|nr:LuxR family transcriptional regulator [Arenibaculum sp.]
MIDFDRFSLGLRSACHRRDLVEAMAEVLSGVGLRFAYGVASILDTRQFECLRSDDPSARGGRDGDCGQMDLVVERAAAERLPFFWWAPADAPAGTGPVRAPAPAWAGSAAGWAVPVHDGLGYVAAMSFGTLCTGDAIEAVVERHKPTLHVMAIHFHARARELPAVASPAACPRLTRRELQCLEGIARGRSRADIGRDLGVRPRTVKFHLESAQRRFQVASTTQAVMCAALLGLISRE